MNEKLAAIAAVIAPFAALFVVWAVISWRAQRSSKFDDTED